MFGRVIVTILALGAVGAPAWSQGAAGACDTQPAMVTVLFEPGASSLTAASAQLVGQAAAQALASGCKIAGAVVEGHIDNAEAANPGKIDSQRAAAAAAVLQTAGLGNVQIGAFAAGADKPVRASAAGVAEPMNRRAEVSIIYAQALAAAQRNQQAAAAQAAPTQTAGDKPSMDQVVFDMLRDPTRCGAPVQKGYACAAIVFTKKGSPKDRPVVELVTELDAGNGTPGSERVTVLIPSNDCPSAIKLPALTVMQVEPGSRAQADVPFYEITGVRGRAENDAMPPNEPGRFRASDFKIERCRRGGAKAPSMSSGGSATAG